MPSNALERLEALPRRPLAFLPTPLLPTPSLRRALGPEAPSLFMKMDDWTGFALGGNKVRKLEFYLGGEGADAHAAPGLHVPGQLPAPQRRR